MPRTSLHQLSLLAEQVPPEYAAHRERLKSVPVYRCSLICERRAEAPETVIRSPADIAALLTPFFAGVDRELLVVVLLNVRNRVIGLNVATMGTLTESLVHPREVFKPALIGGAPAVVLAHNHPSGDPEPSPQDVASTKRLCEAGKILGIEILDHLILGDGRWTSFKQGGLL